MIKDDARSQHALKSVLTCLTFALPCLLNSKMHRVIEEEEMPPESSFLDCRTGEPHCMPLHMLSHEPQHCYICMCLNG